MLRRVNLSAGRAASAQGETATAHRSAFPGGKEV